MKFFTIIGVYTVCCTIHEFITNGERIVERAGQLTGKIKKEFLNEKEETKTEEKPKLRSAHVVQNRIGF